MPQSKTHMLSDGSAGNQFLLRNLGKDVADEIMHFFNPWRGRGPTQRTARAQSRRGSRVAHCHLSMHLTNTRNISVTATYR